MSTKTGPRFQTPIILTAVPVGGGEVVEKKGVPGQSPLPPGVFFLPSFGPYPMNLAGYIENQKARAAFGRNRDIAQAAIRQFKSELSPDAWEALNASVSVGESAGSVGGQFGPKGAAIGFAAGFFGGLVLGLFPFKRVEAINQWREVCRALTPTQRYFLLGTIQGIANKAARQEGKTFPGGNANDPCGPWRWADDPWAGHTIWGGPVANSVFLVETLFEFPCIPPLTDETAEQREWLTWYCMAFASGAHDGNKDFRAMRTLWPRLRDGVTFPDLAPLIRERGINIIGEVRRDLPRMGITSIWNPLITPSIARDAGIAVPGR